MSPFDKGTEKHSWGRDVAAGEEPIATVDETDRFLSGETFAAVIVVPVHKKSQESLGQV